MERKSLEMAQLAQVMILAFTLVRENKLERLVSATYPLDRYKDAIRHAAEAGPKGAIKVAFDMRNEKRR